jgi:hypothetical protein
MPWRSAIFLMHPRSFLPEASFGWQHRFAFAPLDGRQASRQHGAHV